MTSELIRHPAWRTMRPLTRFDRVFDGFLGDLEDLLPIARVEATWAPAVDVREEEKTVTVRADLPGVDAKDIKVTVEGDILTLEGERMKEEQITEEKTRWVERFHGSFRRSIRLPAEVDGEAVEASHKNGVLEITCPVRPESRPRKIEIHTN